MAKNKKSKKAAAKTDQFIDSGGAFFQFARNHKGLVVFGVFLVLGISTVIFSWPELVRRREIKAASQYYQGAKLLAPSPGLGGLSFAGLGEEPSQEDLIKAIAVFEQVVVDHKHSTTGKRAWLALGDAYLKSSQYEKAQGAFQKAARNSGVLNQYYSLSGLGAAQEGLKDWTGAASTYQKIVEKEKLPFRDIATLDLVRVLALGSQVTEAQSYLDTFDTDFSSSSLKAQAKARRVLLESPFETAGLVDTDSKDSAESGDTL